MLSIGRPSARLALAGFICGAGVLLAEGGRAQQVWIGAQSRVTITDGDYGLPQYVRWSTEARFGEGSDGSLGLLFLIFRGGPQWRLGDHFQLGLNLAGNIEEGDRGEFEPQIRAELEPHVLWRLGVLRFDDRNRLESRWFRDAHNWRYRNQLTASLDLAAVRWVPFASQELFVDLNAGALSESRTKLGVVWRSASESGLSLGLSYLLRFTRDASMDWQAQHIAVLESSFGPAHREVWDFDGL